MKRKIYFVREKRSTIGGAEVYLSRLEKILRTEGFDCEIINSIFPSFLPSWVRILLFNVQLLVIKKDKFYFSLERILNPDIYRAGDGVHKIFIKIEKKSRLNLLHPIYIFLERRCFNNAKRIIANSKMIKNEIVRSYQIDKERIDVVYNGIEINDIDYERSFKSISYEFNINKNIPVILYVGSGFKRKGVEEFLKIISMLKHKEFIAFVVGKERNIDFYKQISSDLGIESKVHFTGPRTDVNDFYTIGDIFILPSHYDPFSNVILEAMSYKCAVVTTKQNGAHEIIDKDYIMSSPDDYLVVNQIENLLKNPEKLESIQESNRIKAKDFSIFQNMKETLEVIKRAGFDS